MSSTGSVPKNSADAQISASAHSGRRPRAEDRREADAVFSAHLSAFNVLPDPDRTVSLSNAEAENDAPAGELRRQGFVRKSSLTEAGIPSLTQILRDAISQLNGISSDDIPEAVGTKENSILLTEIEGPDSQTSGTEMTTPRPEPSMSDRPLAQPYLKVDDADAPTAIGLSALRSASGAQATTTSEADSVASDRSRFRPGSAALGEKSRAAPISIRNNTPEPDRNISFQVVRQEVHHAPVQRIPAVEQIANVLTAGLDGAAEQRAASAEATPLSKKPIDAVVRVLQIRLEPAELGTVTVRMRLDANRLELRVEAHQAATAELIRRDQGTLSRLLQSAGYDVDGFTIHVAEPDRAALASTTHPQPGSLPGAPNSSTQGQSAGFQADGRSGGEPRNPQDARAGRWTNPVDDTAELSQAVPARPTGVYL